MDDAHKDQYLTVDRKRYNFLRQEVDRLRSENEYLREELRKTEQRISDLRWQVNPRLQVLKRMGR